MWNYRSIQYNVRLGRPLNFFSILLTKPRFSQAFTPQVAFINENIRLCNFHSSVNHLTKYRSNISCEIVSTENETGCLEHLNSKVLFNSILEERHKAKGWLRTKIIEEKTYRQNFKNLQPGLSKSDLPIALKYLPDFQEINIDFLNHPVNVQSGNEVKVNLPYQTSVIQDQYKPEDGDNNSIPVNSKINQPNWMTDYDEYDERDSDISIDQPNEIRPWQLDYGTPDKLIPISTIPCGGCGALLHCKDTAIPGYLPKEIFQHRSNHELRGLICQRCHFMRNYDTALAVNISADEYPRLLSQIHNKIALVILMVDLMDFPCSIWPNILDIIGTKRPVVVVGNKVDLLPQDSPGFLHNIENVLRYTLEETGVSSANIKHIALVSAKTGFGIDQLITKLHNSWEYKGDVYLIGCTNVGKSTLFNDLLQSDYCKVQAVDLIQRATTSPWPGTTLNLLKFPILRPSAWRLHVRTKRIVSEREGLSAEQQLRQHQLSTCRESATLIGHIGRTFYSESALKPTSDPFSVNTLGQMERLNRLGINPKDKEYIDSKWCYDTPGTVHPDQVINLLTTEELMQTLPKKLLHPRTFSLSPNSSLFIAGLGRLDYLMGSGAIRFTIFASESLPITVCRLKDATEIYSTLLGSEYFAVPTGGEKRLAEWPPLASGTNTIKMTGIDWKKSCADVVLSSAGWVAVTPGPDMCVELQAWTPNAKGIYVRPSLLPYSVNHRGARLRKSPAYKPGLGLYKRNIGTV